MADSSAGSLADRVARQLGMRTPRLEGTGPDGSTTLDDVLRQAGRSRPAASRPPPARHVSRAGGEMGPGLRRLETACDAGPLRAACASFATLVADAPEPLDVVVRLCGAALRDFPDLAGTSGRGENAPRPDSIDVVVAGPVRTVPIRGVDEAGLASVRAAVRAAGIASRTEPSESASAGVDASVAFVVRLEGTGDAGTPDSRIGPEGRRGVVLTVDERAGWIRLGLGLEAGSDGTGQAFLDRLRALCLDPRRALL